MVSNDPKKSRNINVVGGVHCTHDVKIFQVHAINNKDTNSKGIVLHQSDIYVSNDLVKSTK